MCDGDHAAEGAVVVDGGRVTGCYRLFSWLAELGRQRRKDRGRSEGRRLLTGCGHWYRELMYSAIVDWAVGVHRCHVMLVAGRGESLSDPRKERVRFQAGPRFWGTYWPCPLSAVLRTRNPFSSPQLSFHHGEAIGVWDTSMPRPCTVSQVLLNTSDLTNSALPGPPVACCTVQTAVNQIAQVPECPPELRNPGFDSPLLCCAGPAV